MLEIIKLSHGRVNLLRWNKIEIVREDWFIKS